MRENIPVIQTKEIWNEYKQKSKLIFNFMVTKITNLHNNRKTNTLYTVK